MLNQTLRSRGFALLVHAGAWILLVLALMNLGGHGLRFTTASAGSAPLAEAIPLKRIQTLFSAGPVLPVLSDTNALDPFFTRHFLPPVVPPATTRTVNLTYHGYFQTADGPMTALVQVGDALVPGSVGAKAVANLYVAGITWQALTLTNPAGQTNLLPLNLQKPVVVPIQ